jgi:thioredoxin 1
MGVKVISSHKEFRDAISSETPSVFDFHAVWCGPCKDSSKWFDENSEEFNAANFYKIDVDEVPDVAQEVGIRAMPTFMVFKAGEKMGELVGANRQALKNLIQTHAK